MSDRENEIPEGVSLSDDFITLVADDLAVVLQRGMATINFYVDIYTSDFTGQGDQMKQSGVARKLRLAVKLPTNALLAMANVLPTTTKRLSESPDISQYWIHVDRRRGKPRKIADHHKTFTAVTDLEKLE